MRSPRTRRPPSPRPDAGAAPRHPGHPLRRHPVISLSFTHLPTHWDAGEAYTVIAFLGLLRDQLWETYGDEITALLHEASHAHPHERQLPLGFADAPDF